MWRQNVTSALTLCGPLAALLIAGCVGGPVHAPPANGQVVFFDTDVPVCGVESFWVTITSANLLGNGNVTPLVSTSTPATVDFARMADFTSIISTASVRPGTYTQLQMTLTNPGLIVLNTSTSPPTTQPMDVTLTTTSLAIMLNPPLVVSSSATSGLLMDFSLPQSLQVEAGTGQITGTVNPHITITTSSSSGSTVGEATALYGVVQNVSTKNLPSGFTGSFALAVADGAQPTLTILSNASTVFEGDAVTGIENLPAGTFVEVDATVNTSGQIIAQTVDAEEQTSFTTPESAILGEIIAVTRDSSGNANAFTIYVEDEVPPVLSDYYYEGAAFIGEPFPFTLTTSSKYFTNWHAWNQQAFTFGPQTLGLGEKVAVFYSLSTGSLVASQIFLRPRSIVGNFKALQVVGSDNMTGGFTLAPCSGLFGGEPFTVLTYADTVFNGLSGLSGLTTAPTLDITGVFFYTPTSGTANGGATWTAPTWVMQARQVHQLPN